MAVAATGFFDGVHSGHLKVIRTLVSEARRRGEESLVLTFWPHPRAVLQNGARELRLLSSLDEKTAFLKSLGVDKVEVLPFSREFAALTAREYLSDVVMHRYGVTALVVGYDNRLGSDCLSGEALRSLGTEAGLDIIPVDEHRPQDGPVSSTVIRRLVSEGDVEAAAHLLGREYPLHGTVVSGNRIGRTIGFPTANLQPSEPLKLIPGGGVYLTRVELRGDIYYGMTNIGTRPTVTGESAPLVIETNIFDFSEDIYGLPLGLAFLKRLREERHFSSLDELKARLADDKVECMRLLDKVL